MKKIDIQSVTIFFEVIIIEGKIGCLSFLEEKNDDSASITIERPMVIGRFEARTLRTSGENPDSTPNT